MSKKHFFRFVLLLVALLTFTESYSQVCTYGYRKRIRINSWKVSGGANLTNFPVQLNWASDNDLRTVANSGHVEHASGWDIVFTSDDGVTILNHQLEKYTAATGELIAYVNVPTVYSATHTVIYMYYGKTGVWADPSSTSTWDSNFEGVYHFNSSYNDNSTGGNNGTNAGCTTPVEKFANGLNSGGANNYVQIGTTGWSTTTATFEMWGRATSFPAAEAYFLGYTTNPAYGSRIQIYAYNGKLRLGLGAAHDSKPGDIYTFSTATWYHIAVTYNSGNYEVFVNGVSQNTGTYASLTTINTNASIDNNGHQTAGSRTQGITGDIDEMRISSVARTAGWITTSYNNQNSPSTFYTVYGEGKRWTGGTNTNWNTAANWFGGVIPATGDDVTITNGTNQPTLNVSAQVSSIWIKSSATLTLSSNTLSDSLDITNCGTITGSTGTVTMNGNNKYYVQNISGIGTYNLTNLTANTGTTFGITLNKDVNVTGALTLTSGIVRTTTANILALSNTATSTSGSATSFVSGPMSKAGTTAFIFPVGKGTAWKRIEIGVPTSSTTYRAEYFNSAYAPLTPVSSPLHHPSSLNYWVLDRIVGTGDATVKLYWEDAAFEGINLLNQLVVAHYSGTLWSSKGNGATTGGVGAGVAGTIISSANVTTFSPFAFGAIAGWANNPLPVTLISFTAVENGNNVKLNWSTASEVNNDYFTVQKTLDGVIFEDVKKVDGHGNSINTIEYEDFDIQPYNGQSYYRLAQTDFDGNITYSSLQPVLFNRTANNYFDFNVYPNPVNEGQTININLASSTKQEVLVVVIDVLGQEYYSKVIVIENGSTTIAIDPYNNIAAGTYIIKASSDNDLFLKKLIVK